MDGLIMSDEVPIPKLEHPIVNAQTAVSISLVIAIAGGVYNFAYQQGKNESRDKQIDKIEMRLDSIERNIFTICSHIKGCDKR